MKFPLILALSLFGGFSFFVMLQVKGDVLQLHREKKSLIKEQRDMRENLKVSEAEFAFLSRPERLRMFAEQTGMAEIEPQQILPVPQSYMIGDIDAEAAE